MPNDVISPAPSAQAYAWQRCTTCDDVVAMYPERVDVLFRAFDTKRSDLKAVDELWKSGHQGAACSALLAHFQARDPGSFYRSAHGQGGEEKYSLTVADKILRDELPASGQWALNPRTADGGLDWSWAGPVCYDDNQWHQMNRHRWMLDLLFAGLAGKGEHYLVKLDESLRDWCSHMSEHGQLAGTKDRKLNAGIRLLSAWPEVFFSFLPSVHFRDATKILMLAAFADQGEYIRHHHLEHGNHLLTELSGLTNLTVAFPEFSESREWSTYAHGRLIEEITRQFYFEEGVQKELSQNYHLGVIHDYEILEKLFAHAGLKDDRIAGLIERGLAHVAYTAKPNGHCPMFNDIDDDSARDQILVAAQEHARPDWTYILTHGEQGEKPTTGPSIIYPMSGRLYSRSGWDATAQWSAFDLGPWGLGHQHNDKLHLSIHAHGRDLLVDSGRYGYKDYSSLDPTNRRAYVRRSWGHNVILVDGQSQSDGPEETEYPLEAWRYSLADDHDFAWGTLPEGWYGGITGVHERAIFYIREKCWIVLDSITVAEPKPMQALWHLHPDCTAAVSGGSVVTTDAGQGNLRIALLAGNTSAHQVEIVKGRIAPTLQGWYSPKTSHFVPSPCAIYSFAPSSAANLAWVMTTGLDAPPVVHAQLLAAPAGAMRVSVDMPGGERYEVAVDFSGRNSAMQLSNGTKLRSRHGFSRVK